MELHKGQTSFWMLAFFMLLIGVVFYIGKNYSDFFPKTSQPMPTTIVQQPTIVPTSSLLTTVPSPTIPQKSDIEGIEEAFAKKYNKTVDQAEISISKKDDTHAWGSVKFAGEMAGGWFLAYKNPTDWIIVQDGNGTISCEAIAPYDFPSTMAPECVDKNGKLIKR